MLTLPLLEEFWSSMVGRFKKKLNIKDKIERFSCSLTRVFFFKGELKKTISIVITDDTEPEDNESLMIGLVNTEGGSRILPSSDTVTVVILANDHVAGIVGFHPASRSVIARKGR